MLGVPLSSPTSSDLTLQPHDLRLHLPQPRCLRHKSFPRRRTPHRPFPLPGQFSLQPFPCWTPGWQLQCHLFQKPCLDHPADKELASLMALPLTTLFSSFGGCSPIGNYVTRLLAYGRVALLVIALPAVLLIDRLLHYMTDSMRAEVTMPPLHGS